MNKLHKFDPTILREYDIRGICEKTFFVADAHAIGLAFGTIIRRQGAKKAFAGYDGRLTSPVLFAALTEGLAATGLDVVSVGLGPTPMVHFALQTIGADAGVMVTGSHSPLQYNGIKMFLKSAPFYGQDIQALGALAAKGDFESGRGTLSGIDVHEAYVERLAKDYDGPRDLKVVWDAANGAAGEILRRLVGKLPGEHKLLYADIDGSFPNHHPDPTVDENMRDLIAAVKQGGFDLGIGLDGDGDRIGAVDNAGNILRCDTLMTIYAREILAAYPGAPIIADVKSSQVLFDEIERLGGKPVMWKTGHSLIKAKMKELGAPLAGELAGHICFADKFYSVDDGLYCGVRLMNIVSHLPGPLSDLTQSLPKTFNTPELQFKVPETRKFEVAPEVEKRLAGSLKKDERIINVDGVRLVTPDGWWLLRPSNTHDVLTVRVESYSREGFERLKSSLAAQLQESGIQPDKLQDFSLEQAA